MQQQAQDWKNKKYHMSEEITDLKAQLQVIQDRRERRKTKKEKEEKEKETKKSGGVTFGGTFGGNFGGGSNESSATKTPNPPLSLQTQTNSNTNSMLSTTEITRGGGLDNSLMQAEQQLNNGAAVMDNSYLNPPPASYDTMNNTATGLHTLDNTLNDTLNQTGMNDTLNQTGMDTSLIREVQDTQNLNVSVLSGAGGGNPNFYQPNMAQPMYNDRSRGPSLNNSYLGMAQPMGADRSGVPSLNNSYLQMERSFVDQAANMYQGDAEEREIVVEDTDQMLEEA